MKKDLVYQAKTKIGKQIKAEAVKKASEARATESKKKELTKTISFLIKNGKLKNHRAY